MLFGKQKWTSQPQFATGIDPKWINKGLTSVYAPQFGRILVRETQAALVGATLAASQAGIAARFAGGSGDTVEAAPNADALLGTSDGTILMYFKFCDTTGRTAQIAGYFGHGSVADRALLQPWNDGTFYFDWGGASIGGGRVSASYTKNTNPQVVIGVSGGGKGKELWFGKTKVASNGSDTTARPATAIGFDFGNVASDSGTPPTTDAFDLYIGATFKKALSNADLWELADNPNQLFNPRLV